MSALASLVSGNCKVAVPARRCLQHITHTRTHHYQHPLQARQLLQPLLQMLLVPLLLRRTYITSPDESNCYLHTIASASMRFVAAADEIA
jgi:hypothetical protein